MTTESQKEMNTESKTQAVLQLLVLAGMYELSTNLGNTSKF